MPWTARTNLTGPVGPAGSPGPGNIALDPNDPYVIIISIPDEVVALDGGSPASVYTAPPIDGGSPSSTYTTTPIDGGTN